LAASSASTADSDRTRAIRVAHPRKARAPGNIGVHSKGINADVRPFDASAYGQALNCSFTGDD
jgi:hypothetical protein